MVDASERLPRIWQERIGAFCAERLGGAPERWAEANVEAERAFFRRYWAAARAGDGRGARAFRPWADGLWMTEMCAAVGVAAPDDPIAFADACVRFVTAGAGAAALADAASGVRALAARVPRLFTATSQDARQIDGYTRALGIRHLFERTYGGDLVDRFKVNAAFFTAIMADADVPPQRSAMVDDNPAYLDWAREAGMRTYLVERRGEAPNGHQVVRSLTALAERLA